MTARLLLVESETEDQRKARRDRAGKSSGETYAATLESMWPGAEIVRIAPADPDGERMGVDRVGDFDAVFVTGSPMHVYHTTPPVERAVALMRAVFAAGTPSFGSCAGLQLATAAAGGRVRGMAMSEAGVARGITRMPGGRGHPLLDGRPGAWDAPAMHGDEVEALPEGATCLATNAVSAVQAAEIRHDRGVFWGVQYHPELAPGEIAVALRNDASALVEAGRARSRVAVRQVAALFDGLQHAPDDEGLWWELGIDAEFAVEDRRRREIANFIAAVRGGHLRGGA